jgi:hypothetical protein
MTSTDPYSRCADELRDLRQEMNNGFAEMRQDFAIVHKHTGQLAALEARRQATPPMGLPTQEKQLHWAAQAALVTLISVGTTSFATYLLIGWGHHVASSP